ncbi:MAG: XdhC family protein [Amnibacterium sp.]
MLELADRLLPLLRSGARVAVATAIDVVGSSPQAVGTSMALTDDGRAVGSVSGGCVEAAAIEGCRRVLAGAAPTVERYGFGDADAAAAGLACGGELDVLLHPLAGPCVVAELEAAALGDAARLAVVTAGPAELLGAVIAGGRGAGLPGEAQDAHLRRLGFDLAAVRRTIAAVPGSAAVEIECAGVLRLLVEVREPLPIFAIVGGTDVGRALAAAAVALGFRVLACDPRPAFATADRMPAAESVSVDQPPRWLAALPLDRRSAVALLSHDEDLDPLALAVALESAAGYVGALGSRATVARRRQRLRGLGVAESAIDRLRSPMGLDLGGSSAAETAIAVLAEVLLTRTGATGAPLVRTSGPVHAAR